MDAQEPRFDRASVAGRRTGRHRGVRDRRGGRRPHRRYIARTADSILAGAFTGDFAVALERAAAFTDVVALGLRVEAKRMSARAAGPANASGGTARTGSTSSAQGKQHVTKAARLLHTAGNLFVTAKDFRHGASLWRRGKLD